MVLADLIITVMNLLSRASRRPIHHQQRAHHICRACLRLRPNPRLAPPHPSSPQDKQLGGPMAGQPYMVFLWGDEAREVEDASTVRPEGREKTATATFTRVHESWRGSRSNPAIVFPPSPCLSPLTTENVNRRLKTLGFAFLTRKTDIELLYRVMKGESSLRGYCISAM